MSKVNIIFNILLALALYSIQGCNYKSLEDASPTPFRENNKWGAKNKNKEIVVHAIYEQTLSFKDGLSRARLGNKYGYIDTHGKTVIPFIYDKMLYLSNDLIGACIQDKCGYLDKNGNTTINFKYKEIDSFTTYQNNLTTVRGEHGWGVIDKSGREILELSFQSSPDIDDNFILAYKTKHEGAVYDLKGHRLTPSSYDIFAYNVWAGRFLNDGLFTVLKDGKWGFIDLNGNTIIPFKYDKRGFFNKGYAKLVREEKVYLVNKKGEEELIGDWQPPRP